jgi:hypothetical protein
MIKPELSKTNLKLLKHASQFNFFTNGEVVYIDGVEKDGKTLWNVMKNGYTYDKVSGEFVYRVNGNAVFNNGDIGTCETIFSTVYEAYEIVKGLLK